MSFWFCHRKPIETFQLLFYFMGIRELKSLYNLYYNFFYFFPPPLSYVVIIKQERDVNKKFEMLNQMIIQKCLELKIYPTPCNSEDQIIRLINLCILNRNLI